MLKKRITHYYTFAGNSLKMTGRLFLILFIMPLIFLSCRSGRMAVSPATGGNGATLGYIEAYKGIAMNEMQRAGVPASIILAQGIIESGNGRSRLAVEANNHFGIKCHNNWKGPVIRHNDDRRNECFRKYKSPAESFRDHSDFLKNTPRYRSLFDLPPDDYRAWASGLKKAGYATNPDYANMLIRKIEEYSLHQYDNPRAAAAADKVKKPDAAEPVRADSVSPPVEETYAVEPSSSFLSLPARVKENNRIQYIVVNARDTREGIEKELGLLSWELQRYNELDPGFEISPGQILYIQPKRDRAEAGKEHHTAKEGETMYDISQIYGIKLKELYIMNRMETGSEPAAGQKIWLRKVRPVE